MKKRLVSPHPKKFKHQGLGYSKVSLVGWTNCCDATIDPIYLETLRSWWMIPSSELGFRPTWKVK